MKDEKSLHLLDTIYCPPLAQKKTLQKITKVKIIFCFKLVKSYFEIGLKIRNLRLILFRSKYRVSVNHMNWGLRAGMYILYGFFSR